MKDYCILLFLDNEYQRKLKETCFGSPRFEETLRRYQKVFIAGLESISEIDVMSKCSKCTKCLSREPISKEYADYLNAFCSDVTSRRELIRECFDEIIELYTVGISRNRNAAVTLMKDYLEKRLVFPQLGGTISFSKPLFRARRVGKYDGGDIHELFHVPFDMRYTIGNQRFSLSGIPILYTSESAMLALSEIECDIKNANVAVFMPKYSFYHGYCAYDISNSLIDNLVCVEILIARESTIKYEDKRWSINKENIDQHLSRYILSQIIHFPTQESYKDTFVQEYFLPQLVMDIINEKEWLGMIYQSCKDNSGSRDEFSRFMDKNICFKVPYVYDRYNEELLNSFYYATWKSGEDVISFRELESKMDEIQRLCKGKEADGFDVQDYQYCLARMRSHIEQSGQVIGKKRYKQRKDCRVEMTLFFKLLEMIKTEITG